MSRQRATRFVFAAISAVGTFVAWSIFRVMVDDWRAALPPIADARIFAQGRRWVVENIMLVQVLFFAIGGLIAVRQCAIGLGILDAGGKRPATKGTGRTRNQWRLEQPLLKWGPEDHWTVGSAFEGTLIVGATGSGKSSGSGRKIAQAMLSDGFGGLVLTAKSDERQVWESYCRATGRWRDLIVFGPESLWRYNFLDHELTRQGSGAGLTENICHLFSTVLEVCDRNSSGGGGREDESYWRRSNQQLLRNTVDLLALAKGTISVHDLYQIVISAPQSMEEVRSDEWRKRSYCFECLAQADAREKSPQQRRDFEMVADYFCVEFPTLSEKTRSIVVSTFTSMADVLNRGLLRELFCGETNLTPEVLEQGRIMLVDLPVREFGTVGRIAQVITKYAFQRSIERRDIGKSPRPVFWFADEAQNFVTSYDQQFQTTCRSARVATVLLTQNIANVEAALGGSDKGRAETMSLCGNLNTKVFHCNSDPQTNEFAANLIGRSRTLLASGNNSYGNEDWFNAATGLGPGAQTSAGFNEAIEYEVQPAEFANLKTGGKANRGVIEAVVFQNGRQFRGTGRTWLPVTFQQ